MDCDCPPHHPFWQCFARLADPGSGQQLSRIELLNKQVHQLRYLISYQQASWVRFGALGEIRIGRLWWLI